MIGIRIVAKDRKGLLRDITSTIARYDINIEYTQQFLKGKESHIYLELAEQKNLRKLKSELRKIKDVISVESHKPFKEIYGKRVIVIGGGAQVVQVVHGAISEADRHNLRGEKISVDTIPLVGEDALEEAVKAVARLHRAAILVLAGSLMGGRITRAVRELREKHGIPVISLNMAGSVPEVCDLVVTDPVQAGVMAVMAIADTAEFKLEKIRGRRF